MNFETAEAALHAEIRYRKKHPGQRVIAVDFDGTISDYRGWKGYLYAGGPIRSVVEALRREAAAGTKIIVHTCRVTAMDGQIVPEAVEYLKKWMKRYKVPFDEIWLGTGKPYAHEYWDDKAVRKP